MFFLLPSFSCTVHVLLYFLLLVVLLLFRFIICLHRLRLRLLLSLSARGAVRKTLYSCSSLLFSILLIFGHYFFNATYVSICHYQLITLYILNEVGINSCRHYHKHSISPLFVALISCSFRWNVIPVGFTVPSR